MTREPASNTVEVIVDELGTIVNESGLAWSDDMANVLRANPEIAQLANWANNASGRTRTGSLVHRDRFVAPRAYFDDLRVAWDAYRTDDVVAGVCDMTESLALSKIDIECDDADETDIWNQFAASVDFDSRLREIWRELFKYSTAYVATYWGTRDFKVRGRSSKGVQRKKAFSGLHLPLAITTLDPTKIVPVSTGIWGNDQLIWLADRGEDDAIDRALDGRLEDPTIRQLMIGEYKLTPTDLQLIADLGGKAPAKAYLLNPSRVFRHTLTKPGYQRVAEVQMRSIFELLDLKNLNRAADRASLIGSANFIILLKKGSKEEPANQAEINNLQNVAQGLVRLPVIFGDHRLSVEIIAPPQDGVLSREKMDVIDSRIATRLLGLVFSGGSQTGSRSDDSVKLAKVIGRNLESRRHMMRRSIEKHILRPIWESNEQLTTEPKLTFRPKRVALDFDQNLAKLIFDLRTQRELSRQTMLEELDFSEATEARRMEFEAENYDKIFNTVSPWGQQPQNGQPGAAMPNGGPKAQGQTGRVKGGNRNGGGTNPGAGQRTGAGTKK